MKYVYTKEYLRQKLKEKAKELGRTPTTKDMRKPYPSPIRYYQQYNSWEKAVIDAGLELNNRYDHLKTNEIVEKFLLKKR